MQTVKTAKTSETALQSGVTTMSQELAIQNDDGL
jgi:hypothetical protein